MYRCQNMQLLIGEMFLVKLKFKDLGETEEARKLDEEIAMLERDIKSMRVQFN